MSRVFSVHFLNTRRMFSSSAGARASTRGANRATRTRRHGVAIRVASGISSSLELAVVCTSCIPGVSCSSPTGFIGGWVALAGDGGTQGSMSPRFRLGRSREHVEHELHED